MLTPTQLLCHVTVGSEKVALNPDVVVISEDAETLPLSMAEKSKEASRRKDGTTRRREASSVGRTSATDAVKAPGTGARRNERERNRVRQVNAGFDRLRDHVPQGRRNRRLSKVDTLRAAVDYIGHLQRILQMQCVADVDDGYFLVGGSCGSPATSESNSTSSSSNCHQSNPDSDKQHAVSDEFFRDINFNSVTKYDLSAANDLKNLFPVNSGTTTAGVVNGAPFVDSQLTVSSGENCGSQLAISMTDLLIQIAASEKMLSVARPSTESSSLNISAFTSVSKNSLDFVQSVATTNPLLISSVDSKPSVVAVAPTDNGIGEMYYNLRMASSCPQLTNAGLQFNVLDALTSSQNCYTANGSTSTSTESGTDLGAISSSLMSNVDDGLVDMNYWFRDTSCQLG